MARCGWFIADSSYLLKYKHQFFSAKRSIGTFKIQTQKAII